MSLLKKIFARENPNTVMQPLYQAIVSLGRQPHWYERGEVPDTLDGRFDMIIAVLCVFLIRMEREKTAAQESAWLTEIFVTDMDGQLRQIGIGDMVVGKHMGRMMSALGGRLTAYREALSGKANLQNALSRNLYPDAAPSPEALAFTANTVQKMFDSVCALPIKVILAGEIENVVS